MRKTVKKLVSSVLAPWNLEVVRRNSAPASHYHQGMPACEQRLKHAKSIGFNPKHIVDAGAFIGGWTQMASSIFAGSGILAVEPNPHVLATLRTTLEPLGNRVVIVERALANMPGTLPFHIWGDPGEATSASLQAHVRGQAENTVNVEVDTLDNLLAQHHMQPDLVKLDLQGAEHKALLGSKEALKSTEMWIVEFGCLEAYIDRTTPRQLMDIFYDNDYCLYDLVDFHYRPYDGALTGGDFFFVKNDSPLRLHKGWE